MHIYIWQIDPHQLSINALNTTTPNLAHLMADLYICDSQATFGGGTCTLDELIGSHTRLAIYPTLAIHY